MRRILPLCLLVAACSVRQLESVEHWRAAAEIDIDSRAIRRKTAVAGDTLDSADAGLSLRAQGGPGRLGPALGLDLHLGAGLDGGFAYETAFRPLGAGLDLGGLGTLSLTGG